MDEAGNVFAVQWLVNGLLGLVAFLGGWVMKGLRDDQKATQDELRVLQNDLPNTYVRRDDFRDFREELRITLRRMEDKIDSIKPPGNG